MLLSTNPIACAIPAMHEAPVILDMATTVTSYGKVKAKRQRGEMMPEGWMINRDGTPLLDPQQADDGLLLPIGGYKGYGLALIIGMLAGTLNGAALGKDVVDFNHDASTPTNTGQAIMVIDPDAFGEVKEFKERMDSVIEEMRNSERIKGVDRIWLPGEQSHQKRIDYARDGIPIPDALAKQLHGLAVELGIAPLA
jgi:LDH2 family malate/lactate/ureidoglycolate dehydrogenase